MTWLLLATGFSGGLTFVFFLRRLHRWLVTPFSVSVYHSPKGGCTDAIVAELKRARRKFSFKRIRSRRNRSPRPSWTRSHAASTSTFC